MGSTIYFQGEFSIEPPLSDAHLTYLQEFNEYPRLKLNTEIWEGASDPLREAVGLPLGTDGVYYTGDRSALRIPADQLWSWPLAEGVPDRLCYWSIDADRVSCEESGGRNRFVSWLEFLIKHFFGPWGYKLNGKVTYTEDDDYSGSLHIRDNVVEDVPSVVFDPGPSWEKGTLPREKVLELAKEASDLLVSAKPDDLQKLKTTLSRLPGLDAVNVILQSYFPDTSCVSGTEMYRFYEFLQIIEDRDIPVNDESQ